MEVKLFQKKYFVIFTAAVYAVLVSLFYKLQWKEDYTFDSSCYFGNPCVRFCCKNEQLCNQNYVDKYFNASLLPDDFFTGWNASQGVNAHFGKPRCTLKLVDPIKSWKFLTVSFYKLKSNVNEVFDGFRMA